MRKSCKVCKFGSPRGELSCKNNKPCVAYSQFKADYSKELGFSVIVRQPRKGDIVMVDVVTAVTTSKQHDEKVRACNEDNIERLNSVMSDGWQSLSMLGVETT